MLNQVVSSLQGCHDNCYNNNNDLVDGVKSFIIVICIRPGDSIVRERNLRNIKPVRVHLNNNVFI